MPIAMPTITASSLGSVNLSPDLIWLDEFSSARVAQSLRRTLDGGVTITTSPRNSGIAITLQSDADAGLMPRSSVQALADLASEEGGQFVLHFHGSTHTVIFRHDDAPAFTAEPWYSLAYPGSDHLYRVTLKLLTV